MQRTHAVQASNVLLGMGRGTAGRVRAHLQRGRVLGEGGGAEGHDRFSEVYDLEEAWGRRKDGWPALVVGERACDGVYRVGKVLKD